MLAATLIVALTLLTLLLAHRLTRQRHACRCHPDTTVAREYHSTLHRWYEADVRAQHAHAESADALASYIRLHHTAPTHRDGDVAGFELAQLDLHDPRTRRAALATAWMLSHHPDPSRVAASIAHTSFPPHQPTRSSS